MPQKYSSYTFSKYWYKNQCGAPRCAWNVPNAS